MIAAVLRRAGFATRCAAADEITSAMLDGSFDVIVCDVNHTSNAVDATLPELERATPQLLQRTVIITTAPESALQKRMTAPPFAVIRKPFDLTVLTDAVRQCRDRGRRERAPRRAAIQSGEEQTTGELSLARLRQFVAGMPTLRALLANEAASEPELFLRSELRRTARELALALGEVSNREHDRTRAAILRDAARVAVDLGGTAPQAHAVTRNH